MVAKSKTETKTEVRRRRRLEGLTSIEAVLHRNDIASLDEIKVRLGVSSRSEVLRVMIAKLDLDSLTPADVALLTKQAA